MSIGLYMDHNVQRAITEALRRRGVDVITAQEDGAAQRDDELILARATELGRLLFTHDDDFLVITARWLREGRDFAGLAFSPQEGIPYGTLIDDLELIAVAESPETSKNAIHYLPF